MANTNIISAVNIEERKNLQIKPGDTVKVWQKIQEKGKIRLQAFEGLVLARKHGTEAGATFTVRKVIDSVGVEKIFPLYTPMIEKIDLLRRSKVRRAKLYFVREKAAKEIRRQMRRMLAIDKDQNTDTKHTAAIKAELEGKEEVKA
jgi:large subunit ribosomal protein L19